MNPTPTKPPRLPKGRVKKDHPTAVARKPRPDGLYPDEWTVCVPPKGFGFAQILGHGKTARGAWAHAANKLAARLYRLPGVAADQYPERKPEFPCTIFAGAINNGTGTHCPDKKTFARINDYCFPRHWTPATP
jgi:hypothetical protein